MSSRSTIYISFYLPISVCHLALWWICCENIETMTKWQTFKMPLINMLKFRYKIKFFKNRSNFSFCLKSIESLNCFLRCQSVLSRGYLLFSHRTKHLRVLYIILLLDLRSCFSRWSRGVTIAPSRPPWLHPRYQV